MWACRRAWSVEGGAVDVAGGRLDWLRSVVREMGSGCRMLLCGHVFDVVSGKGCSWRHARQARGKAVAIVLEGVTQWRDVMV